MKIKLEVSGGAMSKLICIAVLQIGLLMLCGCANSAGSNPKAAASAGAPAGPDTGHPPAASGGDHANPPITNSDGKCDCENPSPHIYSIGSQSILTFQTNREMRIAIEGSDLWCSHTHVGVDLVGTVPVTGNDFDFERGYGATNLDIVTLVISNSYTKLLRSGDKLTVRMSASCDSFSTNGMKTNRLSAFANRSFTLYETDYYREHVEGKLIPTYDIDAFPLPEEEAAFLFGPLVAKNYFAVRLCVRNTLDQDKLINTGMIVASGRAIVATNEDRGLLSGRVLFTVPVLVSPQSTVHMYSILDDQEPHQPRSRFFRGLEFIGALGAATASAFTGTPPDLIKGIGLYTGVGLPEGKKLWPDSWPGYKRNLVNFGMPELMKVPKNSVSPNKYIFFSKGDLQMLISDQTFFALKGVPKLTDGKRELIRPTIQVISLGFDNLQIPFENVFSPSETDVFFRVNQLSQALSEAVASRQKLKAELTQTNFYYDPLLTAAVLNKLATNLSTLAGVVATNASANTNFTTAVSNLQTLATVFLRQGYKQYLIDGDVGLDALQIKQATLNMINKDLLAGKDANTEDTVLSKLEAAVKRANSLEQFFNDAARQFADPSLADSVAALAKSAKEDERNALITKIAALFETAPDEQFLKELLAEKPK